MVFVSVGQQTSSIYVFVINSKKQKMSHPYQNKQMDCDTPLVNHFTYFFKNYCIFTHCLTFCTY